MYTSHAAAWDAKNRFGLPDELPFEFESIAGLFGETSSGAARHLPLSGEAKTEAVEGPQSAPEPQVNKKPSKVSKADRVKPEPPDRPSEMKSTDPEKDKALHTLWSLMEPKKLWNPMILQAVVGQAGYYPPETIPAEYDTEFITDCLIGAWDAVCDKMLTVANDLPF
jgi:hypothetical protein